MDWHQPLVINGGMLYSGLMGDRYLGEFSSHEAALAVLAAQRENLCFCQDCSPVLTESDIDLMLAIDADEV